MKKIKNYNLFIYEQYISDIEMKEISSDEIIDMFSDADILESIVTDSEELLKTIKAEEVDMFQTFKLNPDVIKSNIQIDELYENAKFDERLNKMKLKKNNLESSEEVDTFIEDTIIIKFFLIYDKNVSELEQPKYIIFQMRKKVEKNWNPIKCYKINSDMKLFYDKLTNKTIEIKKGEKNYIYSTNNSGNDWMLQKRIKEQETDTFKDYLSNDEIKAILLDKDVSITIIA